MRHHDDGFAQRQVRGVRHQVAHEGLVDLEVVDVQLLQVGQRGIPRAEVVQRHLHAGGPQHAQLFRDMVIGVQQQALGDLHRHGIHTQPQRMQMLHPRAGPRGIVVELGG